MIARRSILIGTVVLACLVDRARAQGDTPDLVGQLAREKSFAESGAAQLKQWVKRPSALRQGQQLYDEAKAASDDVIAHLLAVLAADREPDKDVALRQKLDDLAEKRLAFSRYIKDALEPVAPKNTRAGLADALAASAGGIVEGLMKGIVEVWKTWREPYEKARDTLRQQIEAEHWLKFGEVPAG